MQLSSNHHESLLMLHGGQGHGQFIDHTFQFIMIGCYIEQYNSLHQYIYVFEEGKINEFKKKELHVATLQ